MNRSWLALAVGFLATVLAVHAATWGRIERPDFSVSEATVAVDNEARGRSGHMGHALVDCGGGRILAFNSNTPTNRCAGHSGFGWMEYRVSPDYGRTWGEPRVLDYSMRLFKEGKHTALCEKGVRAPDGRIILFFQVTDASRPISCQPWSEPTFVESRDGGETWSDARQACPEKGRIYDAVVDRDSVYFLMPTSADFCAKEQDYVVYKSTNGGPFVRHVTSIEASEKGYGAMEFAKDGSLVVYAYDPKDEEHPQYCISRDRGETWAKPARATCAKFIRNPQLRRVDDDWFLCGRNGGRSWNDPGRGDGLVLYHSTDGIHWDEGVKVDQRPDGTGTGHYSCLLPIREPGRPPRLLLQYSQPYWSHSVNVMHRWIEPTGSNPGAVVSDGKTVGEIVIPRKCHEAETYAGEELQKWIGELTDAYVPVVYPPQTNAAAKTRIWVGAEFARKRFREDFKALAQTDGYAVRTDAADGVRNVYVFGALPRGTLHAAYQLLYRNSDIIWARPDPVIGTVHGKGDAFVVKEADFRSVPKSVTRSWQWTYHGPDYENEWESRNLMNRTGTPESKFANCFVRGGHGHGIQFYIGRKENVTLHPDWYPLVKGKRMPECGQVCLTAYDMIPTYVSNMVAEIRVAYPGRKPGQVKIDYFNLSCADNWTCCECPRCTAPFTCENGTVVAPESDNFRSAQCYTFLNKIARAIRKTCPKVTIGTYAYEFTLPVPPFRLEPNVAIEYCPYGLNEKAPIYDDDTNSAWHKFLDDWCAVCRGVWVRMYLGWSNTFPRSLEYPIRDNGLYYLKLRNPVAHFSSEHPVDWNTKHQPAVQIWDVSGMTAWCICRMWWDPTQDLEAIRTDYCRRAYREAWEPMKRWHDGMHEAFYADKMPTTYNSGDPLLYTAQYVIKPGLADRFRGYLTDALVKARHPASKELIRRQLAHFEGWVAKAKLAPPKRLTVKYAEKTDAATNFESKDWALAESTGDFVVNSVNEGADGKVEPGSPAKYRSTAKLLHDGENLIIRFDCWAPDMAKLPVGEKSADGVEKLPRGDIMEFYIGSASTGEYFQFLVDAGHPDDPKRDLVYDARGYDSAWNGRWTKANRRYDDHWSVIMKVPFADVGINAVQTGKTLFQAIRGKYFETGRTNPRNGKPLQGREMASWNGGGVHQMQNFGELVLELK